MASNGLDFNEFQPKFWASNGKFERYEKNMYGFPCVCGTSRAIEIVRIDGWTTRSLSFWLVKLPGSAGSTRIFICIGLQCGSRRDRERKGRDREE